ncbi:hypothetical protein AB0395_39555 [Streptosporangium sp. NPDC051023]|uniref:hypothetical protein n=1 Tax=Streptosporangium sp. NPDC051023 TaxID=3155410 RepID=UPI00344DA540
MSREYVRVSVGASLSSSTDEEMLAHRHLYERLVERVTKVVEDPEFEPIRSVVLGSGLYWRSF